MTLVIMAAGIGLRFGGLKQIEPVGPNGEFILDYSIYDAIKNGFTKIVFVIREENYNIFRETIGKRIENKIKVEYAFQDLNDIPARVNCTREKPWGTGQAVLCARKYIDENFAVINADDFYGEDCFIQMKKYLNHATNSDFALVGYKVKNTLTKNGAVKRGICTKANEYITDIVESSIEESGSIIATPLNGDDSFEVNEETYVSMNALCFTHYIFDVLKKEFIYFLNDNGKDLSKKEFLLPDALKKNIKNKNITVKLLKTSAAWYGITYKEDKKELIKAIEKLIKKKKYPKNLWK